MREPSEPLVEVYDLWYAYPEQPPALKGIHLTIHSGEWVALLGSNGAGKSTLVKHFNGLLRPQRGLVLLAGQDTSRRQVGELARMVGYLPQSPDRLIFAPSVREEIAFGPRQQGLSGPALEHRVQETLELLDLTALADAPPAMLGYGLRRKVALAAVLALQPRLLILDEPTNGLDAGCIRHLMKVVEEFHRRGTSVVLITHDLELVACYAERVVLMHDGQILTRGETRSVLTNQELLVQAGLAPLPVTQLAYRLAAGTLPGFPTDVLFPDEFVAHCLHACRPEVAP